MLALAIWDWALLGVLAVYVAAGYVILGDLDDRRNSGAPLGLSATLRKLLARGRKELAGSEDRPGYGEALPARAQR